MSPCPVHPVASFRGDITSLAAWKLWLVDCPTVLGRCRLPGHDYNVLRFFFCQGQPRQQRPPQTTVRLGLRPGCSASPGKVVAIVVGQSRVGLRGAVPKHSPLTAAARVQSLGWYVGKLSPLLADVWWFSFGFSSTLREVQNFIL